MLIRTEVESLIRALRESSQVVLMDTEQTCWEGSWERRRAGVPLDTDLREVIQIGAVTVDTDSFRVLSTFDHVIRPKVNPELTPFCVALTGLTQERIDSEGTDFEAGLRNFLDYVGDRPVIVYNADEDVLRENLAIHGLAVAVPSFRRLKGDLERCGIDMTHVNSGKIAKRLGSEETYREHDALADVLSMADGLSILAKAADGTGDLPD
jgi:inhibitor of KinA sporulation pathway (predicted exonuclease)